MHKEKREVEVVVTGLDFSTLLNNAWAMPDGFDAEAAVMASIVDVMRYFDSPIDANKVRMVADLARKPLLATPFLSDDEKDQWVRVVGQEAQPLPNTVISLAEFRDDGADRIWGEAIQTMKTSGALVEADDGTWSMEANFPATSRQDWMQRRVFICARILKDISIVEAEQNIITFFGDKQDGAANRVIS